MNYEALVLSSGVSALAIIGIILKYGKELASLVLGVDALTAGKAGKR
jgi:hypothetical protein